MASGINIFSPSIREKLLNRRLGVYPLQKLSVLDNDEYNINESKNFIERYKVANGILEYTNNLNVVGSTDGYTGNVRMGNYPKKWDKHSSIESVDIYSNIENPNNSLVSQWNNGDRKQFNNYLDYMKNVYGTDSSLINILGGIVSGQGVGISLGNNSVGVVSDFDIQQTLGGRIYSTVTGKDTPLGKFGMKAAAVSMANSALARTQKDVINQGVNWLKGKITFWDKSDDTNIEFYDNSLTIEKQTTKKFTLFGKEIDTGISNSVTNYIGELLGVYNSATKSRLDNESSIFWQDHIDYKPIPELELFYNDNFSKWDSKTQNESLIENTGKINVGFLYNALNQNKYSPNYTIDKRFQKSAIILYDSYQYKSIREESDEVYTRNLSSYNGIYTAWQEKKTNPDNPTQTYLDGLYGGVNNASFNDNKESLLYKTKELFKNLKIDSIVSGFGNTLDNQSNLTQTAVHGTWGVSKGRNLLKRKYWENPLLSEDKSAGYDDPYCRVWTWHKQYRKVENLIRPFTDENGDVVDVHRGIDYIRPGISSLKNHGVLQDNGFVKITPYNSDKDNDVKKYMFSLENLAWKGIPTDNNLCSSQIGNFGGRIMWFPPYNININENTTSKINSEDFIGRGEPVYTYINSERTGNLSFTLIVDHPSIINYNKNVNQSPDDKEQALLRFFAGCDVLDTQNIYADKDKYSATEYNLTYSETKDNVGSSSVDEQNNNPNNKINSEPTQPTVPFDEEEVISLVYFPNDFSGIDLGGVSAMDYLAGEGTFVGNGYEIAEGTATISNVKNNVLTATNGDVVTGFTCTAKNASITSNQWLSKYKSNWYKRDSLDTYKGKNTTNNGNFVDVGFLPRTGYYNFISYWDVENFGLNSNKQPKSKFAFLDLYELLSNKSDTDEFTKLVEQIKSAKKVEFIGSADSNGYVGDNKSLALNRANMVKEYVSTLTGIPMSDSNKFAIITENISGGGSTSVHSKCASSKEQKQNRYVKIKIYNNPIEVAPIEETITVEERDGQLVIKNIEFDSEEAWLQYLKDKNLTPPDISKREEGVRYPKPRYDEEKGYFEKLLLSDDMYQSKIREKIKYFQPAFHSSTPEGFNARLTFLHQCMRQGPTSTMGDINTTSASNLAFGTPPVCVLRLGDFFNTKIIIDSMSINYEPLQWDLNPEGIGVQPMLANITLNFKFIGGSDLTGPIARLQNAVTNNFYANTSVFDDRSDYHAPEDRPIIEADSESSTGYAIGVIHDKNGYAPLYDPYEYSSQLSDADYLKNIQVFNDNGSVTSSTTDSSAYGIMKKYGELNNDGYKMSKNEYNLYYTADMLDTIKPINPIDNNLTKVSTVPTTTDIINKGINIKVN